MSCLLHAYSAVFLFSRTGCFATRISTQVCFTSLWNRSLGHDGIKATGLEPSFLRFRVQCYSSRKSRKSTSQSRKLDPKPTMTEEKDAFFVVRKGDAVGVYKSLSDCQAQVGSSICDPPVSVYKGYSLPTETEKYLASHGLKNALYSIRVEDLKADLFGELVPLPFHQPHPSTDETPGKDPPKKRFLEVLGSESGGAVESASISFDPMRKHAKLDHPVGIQVTPHGNSCIIEFDGASKGNPGQAGAGAVLRAANGSVICRLREGLGKATNNVAEYRALILGMKYALQKGFTHIRVQGDSKLICMQLGGLWKVKNQNMSELYEAAKVLKDRFLSFEICHVLRGSNSEADVQANLAIELADGQIQEA